jgi:hypothetical protein
MMKRNKKRRTRLQILRVFSEAFNEIESHFEMEGFSAPDDDQQPEIVDTAEINLEEVAKDEEENTSEIAVGYDREDVEVAVDVFISRLVDEDLIATKKSMHSSHPSLEEVFAKIFDQKSEIVEAAAKFEESIAGYADSIDGDDMNSAFEYILEIRSFIDAEVKRHEH